MLRGNSPSVPGLCDLELRIHEKQRVLLLLDPQGKFVEEPGLNRKTGLFKRHLSY